MAANNGPQFQGATTKRTSFSGFPGSNASIFLEKAKAGIRGSTPDSEALASSDDEQDQYHRLHSINQSHGTRQARRPSWLTEVQQAPHRKGSFSGSGSFSPASSHPATPAADTINWNANVGPSPSAAMGRPSSSGVVFPWGNAIWTNDSQRGPPTRLTEVLPSPTSLVPPGSTGFYPEDAHSSPPLARDNAPEAAIPFAIPLQPTLKTYRSQSYSVGQLDPDSTNTTPTGLGGHFPNGRTRSGVPYGGLQHRPSRLSMLGEHDPTLLEQLQEVEDDDESSNGSEAGVKLSTQARTIEQLAMENALLRQAAADRGEGSKGRSRAATTNSASHMPRNTAQVYHQRIQGSVPEESDSALYDVDDLDANQVYVYGGAPGRRASEYGANSGTQYFTTGAPENRTLESVKKGHWQSSLGFGGSGEQPQSRRHSFADVPTRQTSLSSTTESQKSYAAGAASTGLRSGGKHGSPSAYGEVIRPPQGDSGEYDQFRIRQRLQEQQLELEHLRDRQVAVTYFSRNELGESHPRLSPQTLGPAYLSHAQRAQHLGNLQSRTQQSLYIVTFKACRADVFYVQEGTGLQVKPGDLVIVEADRGTDLGTVAHDNIPWSKAKEMKESYTEEHYRWLMVFSRHCQDGTPAGANPNGQLITQSSTRNPAISMGASATGSDLPSSDLKPKMIKRLAQAHEIQTLRDKEGNEAKAKRVCQQKVVEHRLNMEILDAEFQMDWKKLTFYYFADSYINFNPLVTDLFKIYKTRIWMSAINPASFVTPVAGLQLPSGLGPGAFNPEADSYSSPLQQKSGSSYSTVGSSSAPHGSFERPWGPTQDVSPSGLVLPHMYQTFQPLGPETHQADHATVGYGNGGQQLLSLQARYAAAPYHLANLQHPAYGLQPDSNNGVVRKPQVLRSDWNHAFQGLSLGS